MNNDYIFTNPFRQVKYISPIDEILKHSFDKAASASAKKKKGRRLSRERKIAELEAARINTLSSEMTSRLDRIVNQFPWIDEMHPFYIELCALIADVDKIKMILGRLKGISDQISKIESEQIKRLYDTDHPQEMAFIYRAAGGRFASLVKKARGDVKYLIKVVKKMKAVPDFNTLSPTVVVAGAPNVGKSSLVRIVSTGRPEVGAYPFTTKNIVFGHREVLFSSIQIVDTPGLLDRPFKERNLIERQSITSIRHIADIIIYMFDYSKDAALKPEEQLSLLADILSEFPNTIIIKVLNKIDLLSEAEIKSAEKEFLPEFCFSTLNKDSVSLLATELDKKVKFIVQNDEKFKEAFSIKIAEEYLPVEEDDELDYQF